MNTISKKKLISSEHLNYLTGLTSRYLHTKPIILGIESSCDDTGSAIVTSDRNILGECLFSQRDVVLRYANHLLTIMGFLGSHHYLQSEVRWLALTSVVMCVNGLVHNCN